MSARQSVCLSVCPSVKNTPNDLARRSGLETRLHRAGSFDTAFAKSPWPHVSTHSLLLSKEVTHTGRPNNIVTVTELSLSYLDDVKEVVVTQRIYDFLYGGFGNLNPQTFHAAARVYQYNDVFRRRSCLNVPVFTRQSPVTSSADHAHRKQETGR